MSEIEMLQQRSCRQCQALLSTLQYGLGAGGESDRRSVELQPFRAVESNMAEAKQRHWCLTAWLILMIIANSVIVLSVLIAITFKSSLPNYHLGLFAIANVVFLVALFQWKKWGFFGYVGTNILIMVSGLTTGWHIGRFLLQVLWVLILYALLQIGKEKRGWTQLE
jgi:hypothetical protein